MPQGYNPEIIEKPRVLDLTNKMKVKKGSNPTKTIEKRYEKLKTKREPFITRARKSSTYTVPNMYPYRHAISDQGDGANTVGWQSFGAGCVNSIANEFVMTLFPPHVSFARLELTELAKAMLMEDEVNVIEKEQSLLNAEKEAMQEHERIAGRVALMQALEHNVVGGTSCLYLPEDGLLTCYPLDRFVNRRDRSGNIVELIIEEAKAIDTFDPSMQLLIKAKKKQSKTAIDGTHLEDEEAMVYTRSLKKGDFYMIDQEVMGMKVGKEYRVHKDNFPFIVTGWKYNYGEDYARSLVELHSGDFHVIQLLSEALAKGMILMADVKYLIRPGSVTDVDHLIESPTGEFIYGNIDDIGVLQLDKYADFTPISEVLDKYERRVGKIFMLGVQRDAERVTAYEVRNNALGMEKTHSGSYSMLALTMQRPYFRQLLKRIGFDLSNEFVSTVITTGLEALSKMNDSDKFLQWVEKMQAAQSLPEGLQDRMYWGDFGRHQANQLSLELPFLMSEEAYEQKVESRNQAQQQQMLQEKAAEAIPSVAPELLKQQQQ